MKMSSYFCFLVFLTLTLTIVFADHLLKRPIVEIENGKVLGTKNQTISQKKTFYAFRGIPYGQPPVGNLRFRPPLPAKNWTGVYNATQDGNICLQYTNPIEGSEDCLFINVYVTNLKAKNLPVLVWIHGGGFLFGDSTYYNYGPDYLLDNGDFVFVSFNYRLGIFGFISTGDSAAYGNYGLKDQVLALQWVQKNIPHFGGDPKKVTIFGESAGAASVSYLLQIPKAKGLFRGAIMDSGSSLCLWSYGRFIKQILVDVAKVLGANWTDSQAMVDDLRKMDYKQLQRYAINFGDYNYIEHNIRAGLPWAPVIEPESNEAVFTQKSHVLLSKGEFHRVPVLVGFNSMEALAPINAPVQAILQIFGFSSRRYVPIDMNANESVLDTVGNKVKDYYYGQSWLPVAFQGPRSFQFFSDDQFARPITEFVRQTSKYTPVYFYIFSYIGPLGGRPYRPAKGTAHTEELNYLFRIYDINATKEDELTRLRMTKLWTNFAKYGTPTPTQDPLLQNLTWPTSRENDDLLCVNINANITVIVNPENKDIQFWNNLYKAYGRSPYDTY